MAISLDKAFGMPPDAMLVRDKSAQVLAENIANADSTPANPGADPYRRKIPTFNTELDRTLGARVVELGKVGADQSDFRLKYEPGHPSADANGNVKYPVTAQVVSRHLDF